MKLRVLVPATAIMLVVLAACGIATPPSLTAMPSLTALPTTAEEPIRCQAPTASGEEPVEVSGSIQVSSGLIVDLFYAERFVLLEYLSGFVRRDYTYDQPTETQVLGPITVDEAGQFSYTLTLPQAPRAPLNDVDPSDPDAAGVQVYQVAMRGNITGDVFLTDIELGGWSTAYTSTRIDAVNGNEIVGGALLIWSPDAAQSFPTGFGEDGLLFTADDPVAPVPAGYSRVSLDTDPFTVSRSLSLDMPLFEGEVALNDLSTMGWSEAFEALFAKMSREYPFTELHQVDWQALHDEFAPRVADAEAAGDMLAFYKAVRDFAFSIPDGHVDIQPLPEVLREENGGMYGLGIAQLDDGRVIAHIVLEGSPAAQAGVRVGAEIVAWNGQPIQEALAATAVWGNSSTAHSRRNEQLRFLVVDPVGTQVTVTFRNPGGGPITATLVAVEGGIDMLGLTDRYRGYDAVGLPVQYRILDSGLGYVKVTTFADDIHLIFRLWERAIQRLIEAQVPGIVIDLRQNPGGATIAAELTSPFVTQSTDLWRTYYFSERTGKFETFGPPASVDPHPELAYQGPIAVLVSSACKSVCEFMAYTLNTLPQVMLVGYEPTAGMAGEVSRGQYVLPGGFGFRTPTGLWRDMDGNVLIEGAGVAPDVIVPRTAENVLAEIGEGRDVVLETAVQALLTQVEQP